MNGRKWTVGLPGGASLQISAVAGMVRTEILNVPDGMPAEFKRALTNEWHPDRALYLADALSEVADDLRAAVFAAEGQSL